MRITKEQALKLGKGVLFGITCTGVGVAVGALAMKSTKDKEIEATKEAYDFEFENIDEEANALTAKVEELEDLIETYKTRESEFLDQIKELEDSSEDKMNEACKVCMSDRSLNV